MEGVSMPTREYDRGSLILVTQLGVATRLGVVARLGVATRLGVVSG